MPPLWLRAPGRRRGNESPQAAARPARAWSVESLVLVVMAGLVLVGSLPFWHAVLLNRRLFDGGTWLFLATSALMLVGLHALLVLLLATRHTVKPLLALMALCSLVGLHMMQEYGVVLDPPMLRNALHTNVREAAELLTPGLLLNLAGALLVSWVLWRVPLRRHGWRRALSQRLMVFGGVLLVTVTSLLLGFQDFGSLMRNQKELRYRIGPGNIVYSASRAWLGDMRDAHRQRQPLLPLQSVAVAPGGKPRLLVIVVGETARAMNFSLNGYRRLTNPELSRLPVINFPQATSCGTSTEVSLPCMFSPYGRADYDEDRIRNTESLPQLLARAGLRVVWLDNRSGCKGVCDGLDARDLSKGSDPALCPGGHCFDEVLLKGLGQVVDEGEQGGRPRDTVVLLHQLGNHGPAYAQRYPPAYARFSPACATSELRHCSQEEIANAYDNAIVYTDHLLADAVARLRGYQDRYDVGLMYASDHGESLGENGLYLHGMPQAIAPREQLSVPMLWWFGGQGASGWSGLDAACLRRRAAQPVSHDHLFHSVLGLMGVRTSQYVGQRDLLSPCRVEPQGPTGVNTTMRSASVLPLRTAASN